MDRLALWLHTRLPVGAMSAPGSSNSLWPVSSTAFFSQFMLFGQGCLRGHTQFLKMNSRLSTHLFYASGSSVERA